MTSILHHHHPTTHTFSPYSQPRFPRTFLKGNNGLCCFRSLGISKSPSASLGSQPKSAASLGKLKAAAGLFYGVNARLPGYVATSHRLSFLFFLSWHSSRGHRALLSCLNKGGYATRDIYPSSCTHVHKQLASVRSSSLRASTCTFSQNPSSKHSRRVYRKHREILRP